MNEAIIAHIQQQCMLEARREYEALVEQANLGLAHMQAIIEQLNKDKDELQHLLTSKLHEVEEYRQKVIQKDAAIIRLNTRVNGLEEEASDSAKNLEDVIKTNDALLLENDKLRKLVNEKDKQISTLLEEHNCLVHKNNKNEETIASLTKQNQHCHCKQRSESEVVRETVITSMSNDSLSSINLLSQLSVANNTADDKYSLSTGKLKSKSEVKREGSQNDSPKFNAEQNFGGLYQNQYNLMITGQHDDHSSLSNDVGPVKCIHIDEEQRAMIGKIIHSTSKATLRCKAKIGNKRCNSTQNINMCLKCNVMCCCNHLYECHSKEHTVFMKMATKKIWCYTCKYDPLSNDGVTSLHKEKSFKKHDKSKPGQLPYNYRGDFSRKSPDHYRSSHDRSKSASQSPSKSTVPAAAQQAPLYHSPVDHHLPITTNSVHTSAESHLSSTRASTDWQTLTSTDIMSSATVTTYSDSHISYIGDAENHMLSTASKISPFGIEHSSISAVTSDSLPALSKPTMTTVDSPATVTSMPRIVGKQAATNGANISDTKLSGSIAADNLKSDILQAPINRKAFKCVTGTTTTTTTTTITGIVPVTSKSYSGTSHTNSWKYPLTSSMSRSETARNSTSTKSTSSVENSLPASSSRPSHRRSSSFHINDNKTAEPTSSVDVAGSLQSVTPTTYQRSWSLDSRYGFDPPPFKGLVNAGLTCFFNSAVQGLSRINQFNGLLTKLFKPGDHIKVDLKKLDYNVQVTIPAGEHGEVSKCLNKTIADIRKPAANRYDTYFDPSRLFSAIQAKYKNSFRSYRQGDAHEVMRCILDAVRMEEIEKVKRGIKIAYTGSEHGDAEALQNGEEKISCKAALRGAHKIRTYIDHVIGGEMLSVVVCDHCKHRAELIEPFLDISLPVPEKRITPDPFYYTSRLMTGYTQSPTLEECFTEYTSEDTLDNDNKFICSKCSGTGDDIQLRRAVKQLKLQTLPEVFIIHLKRFSIDHIITKNSTYVKYPPAINVKSYCTEQSLSDSRQSTEYSLFAVVQHIGTLNFGHYTAYIKMDDTMKWYKADDSFVTEVQETEALNQEAYLLFYHQM